MKNRPHHGLPRLFRPARARVTTVLAGAIAALLAGCSAPVRPDLPTVVSIDEWNSHSGKGFLRVQYRDNDPATLENLDCQLQEPDSHRLIRRIQLQPRLALDPYGTERIAFTLDFPGATEKVNKLDYRLACDVQLGKRHEKTRYRSTLYRIPAENGLYR